MAIIVFSNKNSGENRRDKNRIKRFRGLIESHGEVYATSSLDSLEERVSALCSSISKGKINPECLIFDCGDGGACILVGLLMKYLPEGCGLPPIGILPGGTFNLLAKQCNVKKPMRYIEDIVKGRHDRIFHQGIDFLKVTADNAAKSYGFSFGIGAPVILLEKIYRHKRWKGLKAASITWSTLWRGRHYPDFMSETEMEVEAGVNGKRQNYNGSYAGIMAQTIKSVGRLWKPLNMFYMAQRLPGLFHVRAGTAELVHDLWAYGLPLAYGKIVPSEVLPVNVQTGCLHIRTEHPVKYQINGELNQRVNGETLPYKAKEFGVEHGLTLKIIKVKSAE